MVLMRDNEISERFAYNTPSRTEYEHIEELRKAFTKLEILIDGVGLDSKEKSCALTKLEEAAMWANKAVFK